MEASRIQGTIASRRKKVILCIMTAMIVLMAISTTGLLIYGKNQDNINEDSTEPTTVTAMLLTHTLLELLESSTRNHVSVTTQTIVPIRSETETTFDEDHSETLHKTTHSIIQTKPTMVTATMQNESMTSLALSNEHISTGAKVTSSFFNETTFTTEDQANKATELSSVLTGETTPTPKQNTVTCLKTVTTTSMQLIFKTTEQSNMTGDPTSPNYCECTADGIWTIIQRRYDGSVDFYRNWTEYKKGFGDKNGEFWLGNDALHKMTSSANYTLRIYVTNWDNITKYAVYDTFKIADEVDGYRLTIGGYCGDAGDSMTSGHNGRMFSTKDIDNDPIERLKSAEYYTGAWWYGTATSSSLNGRYHFEPNVPGGNGGYGIMWGGSSGTTLYSLKETKMLIKEN